MRPLDANRTPLTTVVGSYPVPDWLRAHPTRQALSDAMMVVLKTQELAGIDVVADGELSRFDVNHPETNGMIDYFIGQMDGISTRVTRAELEEFRSSEVADYRQRPAGVVRGAIGEGTLNLAADFEQTRPLTAKPLKFTVTGPHMLSKVLLDRHYRDPRRLALAIAEVLRQQVTPIAADVVQVDEANISGHPSEGAWAAEAINRVLGGVGESQPTSVQSRTKKPQKAVHICFGNYGGQTVQKGLWAELVPFMNRLECDHLVLEFARRGYGELESLRGLRPELKLGIGVIDIKDNAIETPETVAERIETACRMLGVERVAYAHPDCGFWMLPRNVADGKMAALVKGRDLFLGRR